MSRKNVPDSLVVEACRMSHAEPGVGGVDRTIDYLMARTGECEKVVYAAMERAMSRGLIECGVSVRTAWPTEKGLALLQGAG